MTVSILNSTISGNTAGNDGGGIHLGRVSGAVTLLNSTVSGNYAGGDGGGLDLYSLYGNGSLSILSTTISGNTAVGTGGGAFTLTGPVVVQSSIVADNTAPSLNDLGTAGDGSFDVSFSLVESPGAANITDNGGNIFNQDPQLGPLTNNGGQTSTHLPAATSPVINTGNPAFTPPPSTDQRGLPRVVAGRIDMGSVEVQMPAVAGTIQLAMSAAAVSESAGTITITAIRTGGSSGAVSVTVNTADGTAVAPADYGAVIGAVLNWADGDTAPKTLNISIVADGVTEPAETFDVILSNPTGGASLGAPANEIVTILDAANVVDVPTVGELGMAVLAAILSLAGIYLVRRQ